MAQAGLDERVEGQTCAAGLLGERAVNAALSASIICSGWRACVGALMGGHVGGLLQAGQSLPPSRDAAA